MKILFSTKLDWEDDIRSGFESTAHDIAFGEFSDDSVREHDLVVPLTVDDLRRLHDLRDALGDNPIPLPSLDSIALCDDKLLLNRALEKKGYIDCVPTMGLFQAYPFILKKRIDEWGANSHIVHNVTEQTAYADKLVAPDYFRQEYIPGKTEYTAHILFKRGRIVCSTTLEFMFEQEVFIKGREPDCGRSVCECPYLELFGRILTSIGFEGLCCFNYKVVNKQPLIFEINPRFGASLGPLFAAFIETMELGEKLIG
jgi:predicted ATP-grasp superfamily ATP-dependent carboligase